MRPGHQDFFKFPRWFLCTPKVDMEETRDRKGICHGDREGMLGQKFYTENRVRPIGKLHENFLQIDEAEIISTAKDRDEIWTTGRKFGIELVIGIEETKQI